MPDTERDDPPTETGRDPDEPGIDPGPKRANRGAVWTLITVATILMIVSALNTWVERQLLDTDNWVETSSALLEDDTVRGEVAAYLVNTVYAELDVGDAVSEQLPEDLSGLGGLLAGALRDPLIESVDALLDTEVVMEAWAEANRAAHEAVVAVLRGEDLGPGVTTSDGKIILDLGALVEQVAESLGLPTDVIDQIPEDAGQIALVESDALDTAQTAVELIDALSVLLVLLVIGLYALAIYLARNWRREAVRNVGLAIALAGLLLLVVLRMGTGWITDGAETDRGREVSGAVLAIGTALLERSAWAGIFIGVLIAFFATLVGPSRVAGHAQRFTAAAYRRQAVATWIGFAVLILVLLAWSPISTPDNWLTVLVIVVLVVVGIEALRRTSLAAEATEVDEEAEAEREEAIAEAATEASAGATSSTDR